MGSAPSLPDGTMVKPTVDRNGLPGAKSARWVLDGRLLHRPLGWATRSGLLTVAGVGHALPDRGRTRLMKIDFCYKILDLGQGDTDGELGVVGAVEGCRPDGGWIGLGCPDLA
ncbi:hypothetical protein ACLOJK_038196 [Asimina triloba]